MKNKSQILRIGWLYPELMSTYGDSGNILVLQKRCDWRNIQVEIIPIDEQTGDQKLMSIDLLFGGGAQDRQQDIVMKDLRKRQKAIKTLVEKDVPMLFVCGSPQLFGNYYEPSQGDRIEGLGIFDIETRHPGPQKDRLIGNTVARLLLPGLENEIIVGFENHGGRTYLGKEVQPLAHILKGYGNNGVDKTEGVVYKNALGCYFHGPLLPKNPHIADYLLRRALERKYDSFTDLPSLDDTVENKARSAIAQKLGITL